MGVTIAQALFTGTNGAAIAMDTGPAWTQASGIPFTINTNKAAPGDSSLMHTNIGVLDHKTSCDVTFNGGGSAVGIDVRAKSDVSRIFLHITADALLLIKYHGGVFTEIGRRDQPFVSGTTYNLMAICRGATIQIYLDGVLVIFTSETLGTTFGDYYTKVGLTNGNGSTTGRWDNFKVESIISTISVIDANFNRAESAQADVNTVITLNGNTFISITNLGVPLIEGWDFVLTGEGETWTATIKKHYLASCPLGRTRLQFNFSAGPYQVITVNVSGTLTRKKTTDYTHNRSRVNSRFVPSKAVPDPAVAVPAVNALSTERNYVYNPKALEAFKPQLMNYGTEKVEILLVGDSITEGSFSSDWTTKGWAGQFTSIMQGKYGNAGAGYIGAKEVNVEGFPQTDVSSGPLGAPGRVQMWRLTDNVEVQGTEVDIGGFGGSTMQIRGNGELRFVNITGDQFTLLYMDKLGAPLADVYMDDALVTTIGDPTVTQNTPRSLVLPVALGSHTIKIRARTTTHTVLANPTVAPVVVPSNGGGVLNDADYWVTYTWADVNGETLHSPETKATVTGGTGGKLTITVPALPAGATNTRIYINKGPGGNRWAGRWVGSTVTTSYVRTTEVRTDVDPISENAFYFNGIIAEAGSNGVIVHKAGQGGWSAVDWARKGLVGDGSNTIFQAWGQNTPHLAIVTLGTNDVFMTIISQGFSQYMSEVIGGLKATGATVILQIMPVPGTMAGGAAYDWPGFDAWPEVMNRVYELADQYNCAVIDTHLAFNGDYTWGRTRALFGTPELNLAGTAGLDPVHPSNAGHRYIAQVVSKSFLDLGV